MRERRRERSVQCLCVQDDRLEVFDTDYDVHGLSHVEVFKVAGVESDRGFEWLLQDLCVL